MSVKSLRLHTFSFCKTYFYTNTNRIETDRLKKKEKQSISRRQSSRHSSWLLTVLLYYFLCNILTQQKCHEINSADSTHKAEKIMKRHIKREVLMKNGKFAVLQCSADDKIMLRFEMVHMTSVARKRDNECCCSWDFYAHNKIKQICISQDMAYTWLDTKLNLF